MSRIHILYENPEWLPPIEAAFKDKDVNYKLQFVNDGSFDLSKSPEEGIYINRMSTSSHTRGHLNGVLFIDHISALKRNMILRKLIKLKKSQ